MTHKYVFDYHENDIYWCTGRQLGLTLHCLRTAGKWRHDLMFEGVPTPGQFKVLASRGQASGQYFLYRTDTIRALMAAGNQQVKQHPALHYASWDPLKPINPEAWEWYYSVVGDSRSRL